MIILLFLLLFFLSSYSVEKGDIMIYFTGDTHFGHANIITHCNRPFLSIQEMDQAIINNWRERVTNNDTVYILGDMFFVGRVDYSDYLKMLPGKKHLIIGNHDKDWMKKLDITQYFKSVAHYAEISDGSHKITLCHYPMMTWNAASKGSYLIYGHIHNNVNDGYWRLLKTMPNALNAGVDINNFYPVTFKELEANNKRFIESTELIK